ncbi:4-hydroxy-3-methylbut-2-enyl diphosphate reductase [bacterium]|nr:4-hydroxy-3-methylbut-2-enyl diphosphate reductase [bacterium]MBU1637817.1 4-hydroxy-3-methylbut-2-enyl diphosphate reductase [bacterium]MBU1921318.1 4-hydroxy-3-methylbut-2-enyl diphosphate reductase [bacterium]
MKVLVDPRAGFCGGVRRVVKMAEQVMDDTGQPLVSLGDIIHNEVEIARLHKRGLSSTDHDEIARDSGPKQVLIRAHGEPPETYRKAKEMGVELIDGTCPVVTRSQDIARKHYQAGEQVVIIGKPYHPETIGIKGHCDNKAVVVYERDDIQQLDPMKRVFILAQTTVPRDWFEERVEWIKEYANSVEVQVENTLCRFVVGRDRDLEKFAAQVDVIIMVGGTKSSNTKALFQVCQKVNERAYLIVTEEEIQPEWFKPDDTVGVTGSASTPHWLLEKVRDTIGSLMDAEIITDEKEWTAEQEKLECE